MRKLRAAQSITADGLAQWGDWGRRVRQAERKRKDDAEARRALRFAESLIALSKDSYWATLAVLAKNAGRMPGLRLGYDGGARKLCGCRRMGGHSGVPAIGLRARRVWL